MKTLHCISLFVLLIGLVSCKKKTVEPDPNFSHFEGNFLCNVDDNYSYDGYNNKDYDQVIRCSIENDSLKVLNFTFPIQSEDQTEFEITNLYGGPGSVTVTYSSGYNAISIYVNSPSVSSGPSSNTSYSGTRTLLPETTDPHPCLDELEGTYELDISYRNDLQSIDTQYVQNNFVTMSNFIVEIDTNQFAYGLFHSYFNQSTYYVQIDAKTERSIQWQNNNLTIDDQATTGANGWIPVDTIHYTISGTK